RTAESVGVEDDNLGLEIRLSTEADMKTYPPFNKKSNSSETMTIGIAPAAHHKTKRLPTDTFIEIIKLLSKKYNCQFVFFGGPGDEPTVSKITEGISAKYQDFSGTRSILKTTEEIDKCDLLITNDTGVLHISAARAVPTVAIFGSTVPEFGFAPRRTPFRIIQKDLKCRPCTHIGRAKCPKKHFDCMNEITAEEVVRAAEELITKNC
ncbi:MAG: glycosyltransferase family 9 protein, partial [Chlorobi bacterium]|nr:glycosyltransferase family 9 protein [Chlorobiota bacterium]